MFDIENDGASRKFVNRKFKYLGAGEHLIRFVEPERHKKFYTHWLQRRYVNCLGEDCPQCELNKSIYAETGGKNYRDVKGYAGRTLRVNATIFDKTPVKVCSKCEAENNVEKNGRFPASCYACETTLVDVEPTPSNQVKIISGGRDLFGKFNMIDDLMSKKGKEMDEYDININVSLADRKRDYLMIPVENDEPVEYSEEDLPELNGIELTREELISVMRGVQVSDIYSARKAEKESETELVSEDVDKITTVTSRLDILFPDTANEPPF